MFTLLAEDNWNALDADQIFLRRTRLPKVLVDFLEKQSGFQPAKITKQ